MSYIVLARKYRPRNFTEMVGQDHVVQALSNALTTQRLHHAYLFTGTRGVGKTTVSRILAKSLNCQGVDGQGGITATPCGVCQACKDIDAGRFVDYTELDAASNRGVGEVQSLLEQAVYKPVQGRFKVFMIDEVHMLTNTAFNAMLKTLEEPPEYLKFVLATTDPQKVPVTVLSRCLQFNLRPMAPETIREYLEKVLPIEGVQADTQALRLLSRAARGSMRDALSLTDQAIAYGSGRLEEAAVRQMLGSVDRSYVFRLIDALAQGDGKTVVETSEALRLNGLSAGSTLEEMVMLLQRMAVVQAVPSLSEPDDSDPDAAEVIRLAACMPADETQLLYSLCLQGGAELGLAPDEYAALTMVLLRLLAFKPGGIRAAVGEKKTLNSAAPRRPEPVSALPEVSPASPSAPPSGGSDSLLPSRVQPWEDAAVHIEKVAEPRVSQGQVAPDFIVLLPAELAMPLAQASASLAPKPVVHAVPVVEAPLAPPMLASRQAPEGQAATPSMAAVPVRVQGDSRSAALSGRTGAPAVVPTPEGDFWHALVMEMAQRESITAFVRELALQSQLLARDADQWQLRVERESLNQPSARDRLTAALLAAGHAVRLVVEVGRVNDSPAKRNAVAAAERQLAAEKIIVDDPFVQAMMRDFGAKIVPGSIKPG